MSIIIQKNSPVLRTIAQPVQYFNTTELSNIISDMAKTMFQEPDGIGIAAPQIDISLQIFLVASDVLSPQKLDRRISENRGKKHIQKIVSKNDYLVFINTSLKKLSTKKTKDTEGCLSVRGYYGEVVRPEKLSIEYYDEVGIKHRRGASGLLARVIQHEMDHLSGILFIDKAIKIEKIDPQYLHGK